MNGKAVAVNGLANVAAIVLASGLSRRYGPQDKLLVELGGRPLAAHVADAVRGVGFAQRVAVCASPEVAALFAGFTVIRNPDPDLGQQLSLRLGAEAVTAPSVLICLADMPLISGEHLSALCDLHARTGEAVATEAGSYLGPPAVFGREALFASQGKADEGARRLLRDAVRLAAPAEMVKDFDTPDDFRSF
jgi:molybdenum cofactor cytidylyltransferase